MNIIMQKTIVTGIILFIVLISACHKKTLVRSSKKNNTTVSAVNDVSKIKDVIIDPLTNMNDTGASYIIDSVKVNNDIISIFVNYSGGCQTHSFDLHSNGAYGKSLPPQVSVCLKHISNNDGCRQLISEELKFNIAKLKYQGQKTVIIQVGNKQRVYYVTH